MTPGPWHWAADGGEPLVLRGADGAPVNHAARVAAEGLPGLLEAARAVLEQHDREEAALEPAYRGDPPAFAALRAAVAACEGQESK